MDVRVEATCGENFSFARDDVGAGADDDIHTGLDVRIASLADGGDVSFLDRHIGFHNAPMIDNKCIGNDSVGRTLLVGHLRLAHAVANDFSATEFHFLAIGREILLDFDDQIGVGKSYPVAGGGTEHICVDGT